MKETFVNKSIYVVLAKLFLLLPNLQTIQTCNFTRNSYSIEIRSKRYTVNQLNRNRCGNRINCRSDLKISTPTSIFSTPTNLRIK